MHSDFFPSKEKYHRSAHFQPVKMPFWPLKWMSKLAKMVKDSPSPHSYPKIGVSELQNAPSPHLPWRQHTKIHRFKKNRLSETPCKSTVKVFTKSVNKNPNHLFPGRHVFGDQTADISTILLHFQRWPPWDLGPIQESRSCSTPSQEVLR